MKANFTINTQQKQIEIGRDSVFPDRNLVAYVPEVREKQANNKGSKLRRETHGILERSFNI